MINDTLLQRYTYSLLLLHGVGTGLEFRTGNLTSSTQHQQNKPSLFENCLRT